MLVVRKIVRSDVTCCVAGSMGNYVCMCFGAQGRAEPCWKARRAVDLHSEMADEDSITICKLKEVERNL